MADLPIGLGSFFETDVPLAATCNIGSATTTRVRITAGTGPLTSFGAGTNRRKKCRAAVAFTLTHNATTLSLPTSTDIAVEVGDSWEADSNASGNWVVTSYQRKSGIPVDAASAQSARNSLYTYGLPISGVAALTAAFAAGVSHVYLPSGAWAIGSDYSIPAGKAVIVGPGASFVLAGGFTLTFGNTSHLQAGLHQIFSGAGLVANLRFSHPEWWGATDSASVTCNAAMQLALDALRANGELRLQAAFYAIDGTTPLAATKGQQITGKGFLSTVIRITTAETNFVQWTVTNGGVVKGLSVINLAATPTSGIVFDFDTPDAGTCRLKDINVTNCYDFLRFNGNSTTGINDCRVRDFRVIGIYGSGILVRWAANVYIETGMMSAIPGTAPNGLLRLVNGVEAVIVTDVQMTNSEGPALVTSSVAGVIDRGNDVRWCKFTNCVFDDSQCAADLNCCEIMDFVNCEFSSSGRTISGYTAGPGVRLRITNRVHFYDCWSSNHGDEGVRVENTTTNFKWSGGEIAGNNTNANGSGGVSIEAGTTDFTVEGATIGNGFGWLSTQDFGIEVEAGASDRYELRHNNFVSQSNPIIDGGTGIDKDVSIRKISTAVRFAADGTWSKPIGAKRVHVIVTGAGGGGGGGGKAAAAGAVSGGGGGGGAGRAERWYDASELASTVAVTVPAGGAGGAGATVNGPGVDGTAGTAASFGSHVSIAGGGRASAGNAGVASGGGGGGSQRAVGGNASAGTGGTAASSVTGTAGGSGATATYATLKTGGAGGGGCSSVAVAGNGAGSFEACGGGGAGGGVTAANAFTVGGTGLHSYLTGASAGGATEGAAGSAGPTKTATGSDGGGGGAGSDVGTGGAGGAGGIPGGGGGGGGGAHTGNGGAGGAGGRGEVLVTTYF